MADWTGTPGTSDLNLQGGKLTAAAITVPTVGPVDAQQHALPAVASDTVVLLAAAQTLTGKTFGGTVVVAPGTVTTDTPILSGTETWNAGGVTFTALKAAITDVASAAASKLLDLLVAGASKFTVDKGGIVTVGSGSPWQTWFTLATPTTGVSSYSLPSGVGSVTTDVRRGIVSNPMNLLYFAVTLGSDMGGSGVQTWTVNKNGAATAATFTITAPATAGSWSGSVAFAANDLISLVVATTGASPASVFAYGVTRQRETA